jgi:hypothetical protein
MLQSLPTLSRRSVFHMSVMGHAIAYWLRHYATNRKVAGLRPDEVNEFFQFT